MYQYSGLYCFSAYFQLLYYESKRKQSLQLAKELYNLTCDKQDLQHMRDSLFLAMKFVQLSLLR